MILGAMSLGLAIGTTLVMVTNPRKWRNVAIFWYVVAGLLGIAELIT